MFTHIWDSEDAWWHIDIDACDVPQLAGEDMDCCPSGVAGDQRL